MRCPSCGSSAVFYDKILGEEICTRCGLVILERLVETEHRPVKTEIENGATCVDITTGVDATQHDWGIGSKFSVSRDIPPSLRASLRRMWVLHNRSRASRWNERSLREALVQVDKLCEELSLPKGVGAEISFLYRKARAKGLASGHNSWLVSAALSFIVCRLRGIARTEDEIFRVLVEKINMDDKKVLKNFRRILKLLVSGMGLKLPNPLPNDYIDRFAFRLEFPRKAVEHAHEICSKLPVRLRTKPATLLASAALYNAAETIGLRVPLHKVATQTGVGMSSLCQTAALVREFTIAGEG